MTTSLDTLNYDKSVAANKLGIDTRELIPFKEDEFTAKGVLTQSTGRKDFSVLLTGLQAVQDIYTQLDPLIRGVATLDQLTTEAGWGQTEATDSKTQYYQQAKTTTEAWLTENADLLTKTTDTYSAGIPFYQYYVGDNSVYMSSLTTAKAGTLEDLDGTDGQFRGNFRLFLPWMHYSVAGYYFHPQFTIKAKKMSLDTYNKTATQYAVDSLMAALEESEKEITVEDESGNPKTETITIPGLFDEPADMSRYNTEGQMKKWVTEKIKSIMVPTLNPEDETYYDTPILEAYDVDMKVISVTDDSVGVAYKSGTLASFAVPAGKDGEYWFNVTFTRGNVEGEAPEDGSDWTTNYKHSATTNDGTEEHLTAKSHSEPFVAEFVNSAGYLTVVPETNGGQVYITLRRTNDDQNIYDAEIEDPTTVTATVTRRGVDGEGNRIDIVHEEEESGIVWDNREIPGNGFLIYEIEPDTTYNITVTVTYPERSGLGVDELKGTLKAAKGEPFDVKLVLTAKDAEGADLEDPTEAGEVYLTYADDGNTRVAENAAGDGYMVYPGTMIRLHAVPAPGYRFEKWTRNGELSDESGLLGETFSMNDSDMLDYTASILEIPASQANTFTAIFVAAEEFDGDEMEGAFLSNLQAIFPEGRALTRMGSGVGFDAAYGGNSDAFQSDWLEYEAFLTKDETALVLEGWYSSEFFDVRVIVADEAVTDVYEFSEDTNWTYIVKPDISALDQNEWKGYQVVEVEPGATQVVSILVQNNWTEDEIANEGKEVFRNIYTVTVTRRLDETKDADGNYEQEYKHWTNLNPQIILELDSVPGKKVATVNVAMADSRVTAGAFTLQLNTKAVVPVAEGEAVAFTGFCDANGTVMHDGTYGGEYMSVDKVNSNFKVEQTKVWSDGDNRYLHVTFASNAGNPVAVAGKDTIFLKLYLLKTDESAEAASDADLITALAVAEDGTNGLYDADFGELTYMTETESFLVTGDADEVTKVEGGVAIAEENRVVYLRLSDKYYISMFVYGRPDGANRITYNIHDLSAGEVDDTVTVNDLPVALGEKNWLHYVTAKGSFVISFHSPGFLRQETEEISVKTEDVPMGNIRLIGGDVDGNGYIDASDRQYLIMVMGGDVITNADFDADPTIEATGGSRGDVLFGDDYLHADLNDDDTVNAIDLGIVLNGIGKSGN
ncbi:MAG: hypothetical protein IIU74_07190 [Ruminiclostridium sp.]|nr:hypothetical protein [Ruminiclostridium sp.]